MPKAVSPFRNYSIEEIMAFEAESYMIQVGMDVFDMKGSCTFTKKSASRYYNKIRVQILKDYYSGTAKEKKNAKRLLENFKILPFRFH